jgi:hypothetical protein
VSPDSGRKGSRGRGSGRGARGTGRGGGASRSARPSGSAPPDRPRYPFLASGQKRLVALVLAAALVLGFVAVAAAQGLGGGDVPEGAVAEVEGVDDGTITQEEFDSAFARSAEQQGLKKPPEPGDQEYEILLDTAMGDLLVARWILGEAEDRGITVSPEEVSDRLGQIVEQSFPNEKAFTRLVEEQGYCTEEELQSGPPEECAGVQREVQVQLLAQRLQEQVLGTDPEAAAQAIPEEEVELFYEQNIEQFQQPETRDVRLIQNKDPEEVQAAFEALEQDDSAQNWKRVAQKYSTDPASKDRGGLLEGVIQGQSPGGQTFDEQLFSDEAASGELIGPFEAEGSTYLLQVDKVNPEETTPLSDVSDQIRQQLASVEQDASVQEFEDKFFAKWSERTICADGYIVADCENAPPEDLCPPELEQTQGCPPAVVATRPAAPGTAGVISATTTSTALPQGPLQPPPPSQGQLAPGAVPLGPTGAPPVPGAVPPGAVPPGAVPPGTAPPTTAPPAAPPTAPPGAAPPVPPPSP